MLSSGTTAQATTSDTAVTVIAASDAKINRVTFINEGTVAGFGSIDAGVLGAHPRRRRSHLTVAVTDRLPRKP
jgi:hypothetical protein